MRNGNESNECNEVTAQPVHEALLQRQQPASESQRIS